MADFDKININGVSYNVKDTTARKQIGAEITDREHADTTLSQQIGEETTAREHADTQLSKQISDETTARKQAVADLTEQFSEITAWYRESDTSINMGVPPAATATMKDKEV